jgi:cysteine synthase A
MHEHLADAIRHPALVSLTPNLCVARFEVLKVYSALAAVEHLLGSGRVNVGTTLLDSSSGVYAAALALACHKYGLKCHVVASASIDPALKAQLEILGCTVDLVAPAASSYKLDQDHRVARVKEILRGGGDVFWMQQYHDDVHYRGYAEFADLIRDEFDLSALTVIGGIGSGASTGGLARYLRRVDAGVELCGVEPFGSVTFGSQAIEDPAVRMSGIGSAIPFRNVRHSAYDRIHWVSFDYAMSGAVELLRRHAVFAGLSAGAAFLAARWEAERAPERDHLFIAADTGHRYFGSVYSRHQEALAIDALKPARVASLGGLQHPWSVMEWRRRPYELQSRRAA